MRLIHKKIPTVFLEKIPRGLKYVKKYGQGFLVVEKLYCRDGHSLMDRTVHVHGKPSIRIHMKVGKSAGLVFVDAFWGGHARLYSFIPSGNPGRRVQVTCPVCGVSMLEKEKCRRPGCRAAESIVFYLPGKKNKIHVCAKLGCPGHRIEIVSLPHEVSDEVSGINYPDASEEDMLLEI